MRLFGLIGYPLGHSFSKKYFTGKFQKERISNCAYELFPIQNINELSDLLGSYPNLEGINVTIPYKQQVLSFLTDSAHLPAGLNACNCIKISNGQLAGYNTDVSGFEKSFLSRLQPWHTHALVLGTGGASAAVVFVLKKLGINYKIVSRKAENPDYLPYEAISSQLLEEYPVIINTTPLGTHPATDSFPALPYEALSSRHYLFDLVYNPEKTVFLQKGEARGAIIQNGYDMLVQQAEDAWKIWNE